MGPECEFFVFDEVSYDLGPNHSHYAFDSAEGHWNSGKPGLGNTIREKEGYFPPAPHDTLHDLRSAMVLTLERLGIPCEFHHHEVASGGQCEIDLRYQPLTRMADQVMTYKYVVKNVARAAGKTVTFMPKPLFGDNGSGMHTHQSLWKEGTPLMADKSGYAGLSQLARSYLAGLLEHAPALLAFCAPTTNSYRRLVPGYEAPVNLVYSQRNRSACIRIPMYSDSPKAKRIEFRCPDAAANPYLAFAAMLMAGIDGVQKGLEPGEPADYDLFEEDSGRSRRCRARSAEALDALEADHEFLTRGGVFSRGADPDLDRLEAGERGRRGRAPAAPGRVRPLLRRVAWRSGSFGQEDWPAVREIYEQGIAGRNATFETEAPVTGKRGTARNSTAIGCVAVEDGRVVGWVAVHPVSPRPCYARRRRAQRVRPRRRARAGNRPRAARAADRGARSRTGIWTIQTGVFPENEASLGAAREVRVPRRRHAGAARTAATASGATSSSSNDEAR